MLLKGAPGAPDLDALLARWQPELRALAEMPGGRDRLHRHLDEVFPELPALFDRIGPTLLALLAVASSPRAVMAMPENELATLLWRASRGNLGRERARDVRTAAEMSVGSPLAAEAHQLAIRQLVADLRHLHGQLSEVEVEMKTRLAEVPYAADLLTIHRLGETTLATLLGEFGDVTCHQHGSTRLPATWIHPGPERAGRINDQPASSPVDFASDGRCRRRYDSPSTTSS